MFSKKSRNKWKFVLLKQADESPALKVSLLILVYFALFVSFYDTNLNVLFFVHNSHKVN